ncbi:hypothetical protein CPAR01_01467, partial [Colletotrichum paranaense]
TLVRLAGAETVSLSRNFRCPRHGKRRTNVKNPKDVEPSVRQRDSGKPRLLESWVTPLHVHFLQWGTDWELFDFHEPMFFSFYFEWGENADGTKRGSGVCVRIHTSYG